MDRLGDRESAILLELIESVRWQRLQDHFSTVLGVTIRTVNLARELLVAPSWPSSLASDRVIQLLNLGEELDGLIPQEAPPATASTVTTPLGLTYALVPIRITEDQTVAYFVIGPVIVGPREEEAEFRQRVALLGMDAQLLWPVIVSLKLYTFASMRSVLRLLEEVGTSLAQLAHQSRRLGTILSSQGKIADHAITMYHADRVLQTLLETASIATKAEGGSVMVYDARQQALQIKTARGLSEEIVEKTSIPRGEGLAGLAVLRQAILLLDARTQDESVKQRMQREDVVSAVVAPIIPEAAHEPMGVLNLRTSNPQRQFTDKDIELLKRLLHLASIALTAISLRGTPSKTSASAV